VTEQDTSFVSLFSSFAFHAWHYGKRMKQLALALAIIVAAGEAEAAALSPVTEGKLNGIPFAQIMGTANILGEWRLRSGGQLRLESALTHNGGECGVSGIDGADFCGRFTLLVSANGETSVPVDFVLFRGPETLGWKVPKDAIPDSDYGKFSIPLSACEMKKTSTGTGLRGTSYLLHLSEDLKTLSDGFGHFVFIADLEKLPGERPDCS
jgi:hypothetical protein